MNIAQARYLNPPVKFRPMLAAKQDRDITAEEWYRMIKFPVIATPKIDGIRCVTMDISRPDNYKCEPVCRSLKSVPNAYVREMLAKHCDPGLDGELVTYEFEDLFVNNAAPRPFHSVQSDIMSERGTPTFRYHVFDFAIFHPPGFGYQSRLNALDRIELPDFCVKVPYETILDLESLLAYEAECVAAGHEGICFRAPDSPYKCGRSTMREGWLVKMKRFVSGEAVIVGMTEEMGNDNPITYSELGYAERSTHKDGMSPKMRMGALIVRRPDGAEFKCGTGFDAQQRADYWARRGELIGMTVTYKHQPHGAKELPRIPVFVGFRNEEDL